MNKKYKQNFLRAGNLAKQVRDFGKSLIKKDASYNEIIAKINQKIGELGALAAFPPQIALDEVAAHFLPQPNEDIILTNQVVKLDIGVCYQGAIGDCAVTIDLSGKHQTLIDAAEAALKAAEQSIKVGQPISEIGQIIESAIASFGLASIKNLSGHGLGLYQIHTSPLIPNYNDNSKGVIKAGMTFAIEPFATTGKGFVYESGIPSIFSLAAVRPVHSEAARTLLSKIKSFKALPFAIHDLLSDELPFQTIKPALNELLKAGIIVGYAPLIEKTHGIVAQAENSILVDEKGNVFISTR